MRTQKHTVGGAPVTINVVETAEDLTEFDRFIQKNLKVLAVDSETTGLDIYSDGFRCRLVQFGNPREAWVVPVERGSIFQAHAVKALQALERIILHNASYDLQVFDRTLCVPMEWLWPKVTDTRILAHLIDPRSPREQGVGTSLEDLTRRHIDAEIADNVKGLMNTLRLRHKVLMKDIWRLVDLNDPDYQTYAGMDTILAARLLQILDPLVPAVSRKLIGDEIKLAEVCASIERNGFQIDIPYTKGLSEELLNEELMANYRAEQMGCLNLWATEQVADVLESRGITIPERTETGLRKVDKVLLERLRDGGDEFAAAVVEAKRARKWRTTWVDGFLQGADHRGRCHASINPLRARTARMSITGIPAQTLPGKDWIVRRCFVADEGHRMVSVDYQAQELRVLAALSGDPTMRNAFKTGADLHQITADASGVDRSVGKTVNFAYVYGSGPRNIAEQCGISLDTAKSVIAGFEQAYPKVKEYTEKLQRQAVFDGCITTPFGRRLPVDESRPYAALNYMVQSSSRDVTAQGLLRLHSAGFTPYLRLPIHDEVLASVPADKAEWGAKRIGELMATTFNGVHIGTDAEVGGRSWGSLYGSDY